MSEFRSDVLRGLQSPKKYLEAKYFYNSEGDKIFAMIMHAEEYYPARCELEIFQEQADVMAGMLSAIAPEADVVELGAGNALKSKYLLRALYARNPGITYFPIDISEHVIDMLVKDLPLSISDLKIHGYADEYFSALKSINELSDKGKIILFLGSTIGNMEHEEVVRFCSELRTCLSEKDVCLIGFDLRKDPEIIRAAYNDSGGLTREFNLNLLRRINDELNADFDTEAFIHYPSYDPETGECKSFLVSKKEQEVHIDNEVIKFEPFETIYMEISRKFTLRQIGELANLTRFSMGEVFYDSRNWFGDVVWKCDE